MTPGSSKTHIAGRLLVFVSVVALSGCRSPSLDPAAAGGHPLPAPGFLGSSGFEVRSGRLAFHSRADTFLDFSHLPLRGPRHPYSLQVRFYIASQKHPCVVTDPEAYHVALSIQNDGAVYTASYPLEEMSVSASPTNVRPSYVGDPFYYIPPLTPSPLDMWESSATGTSTMKVSITRKPPFDDVIACEVVLRTGGTK